MSWTFPSLRSCHRLRGLVDTCARGIYIKTETPKYAAKQAIHFHATPSSPIASNNNLLKQVLGLEGNGFGWGIMQFQVLRGNGREMVFHDLGKKIESIFWCFCTWAVFFWKADSFKVLVYLGHTVAGSIRWIVEVDHVDGKRSLTEERC